MARIRTIKPDFFTSETVTSLAFRPRLTFIGLWTYADDDGRGRDDPRLVKAALYPLDDDVSIEDVARDLGALAALGLIDRYKHDGRSYFVVTGWAEHQRISHPTKSKIPAPPEASGDSPEALGSPPEALRPEVEVEVEQGSGSGSAPDRVDEFAPKVVTEARRRIEKRRAKGEDIGPALERIIHEDVVREFAEKDSAAESAARTARDDQRRAAALRAKTWGESVATTLTIEEFLADVDKEFPDDAELAELAYVAYQRCVPTLAVEATG